MNSEFDAMLINRRKMIVGLATAAIGIPHGLMADVQIAGGHAFGSSWRILAPGDADPGSIHRAVNGVVADVGREMSPFDPNSHLSQFNRRQDDHWQVMPPALCRTAALALRMSNRTGGAFDPTVGPAVARFGFGPILGQSGDYRDIKVRRNAIRKTAKGLTLDLCGIAKGYALDEITTLLAGIGVSNALIEVGGEIRALGQHPSGRAWQVAIADPLAPEFSAQRLVTPGAMALATSGPAANGLRQRVQTSHIIAPSTASPRRRRLPRSVCLRRPGPRPTPSQRRYVRRGPSMDPRWRGN